MIGLLLRTTLARRLLGFAATRNAEPLLDAVGWAVARDASFASVQSWPERLAGFEDCVLVFSSNAANHGIAQLMIDEGAHLFRLVRETPGPHVEIGRYKGGATFVLAAALRDGDVLHSYDTHEKAGREVDDGIRAALARYGLDERVDLVVADSHATELPARELGVVFLDGDPTYEGTRADVERWGGAIRAGGHLLLHDATPDATRYAQLRPLVTELDHSDRYVRHPDVGTLVHYTVSR